MVQGLSQAAPLRQSRTAIGIVPLNNGRSISSEICFENNHKSAVFYRLLFGEVCSENSREIGRFFHEIVPKNPAKFDFFVRDLSEALLRRKGVQISVPLKMKMSPKILAKGTNCPPVIKS